MSLPKVPAVKYEVHYENNAFSSKQNKIIELLGEFFRFTTNLIDSLELAFEYIRRKPEHLPELIHKIREKLIFDYEDERIGFSRQKMLFQILHEGLFHDDVLYSTAFFELSKTFLGFKYQHTKGGRHNSFYWYDYPIPNEPLIQEFRRSIWESLEASFEKYPDSSFNLLQSYASVSPNVVKEIMEYDLNFLIRILENKLNADSFEHCRYIQDQIRWCKRNSISNEAFASLTARFRNQTYEVFVKLDWNKLRDKDELEYEFKSFNEYERLKGEEIRNFFVFKTISEISQFYATFLYLFKTTDRNWNYLTSLDIIIDENCHKNFDLGCSLIKIIVQNHNEIRYIPRIVFFNQLKTELRAILFWNIIQGDDYNNKFQWELSFFENLDESAISTKNVQDLISTFNKLCENQTIHFHRLEKYTIIEPKLFHILLSIVVQKNEIESMRVELWMDFFDTYFDKLGHDIELIKKSYLQQEKINTHFDFHGKGFLNILRQDSSFLIEYVRNISSESHGLPSGHKDLSFIWQIEDVESLLIQVFDFAVEEDNYYGILEHFCNSFFRSLQDEILTRARSFLFEYCRRNFNDYKKINIIVDIARHTMKDIFEEVLFLFLSLNQDVEVFSKILWRGSGATGYGDVILADIEMADWKRIQNIVEKSQIGIKLIPIKKYLMDRIEICQKYGDWERQRRFLERS